MTSKRKKGSRIQNNRDGWTTCWICEAEFKSKNGKKNCRDCDDIAIHMYGEYD